MMGVIQVASLGTFKTSRRNPKQFCMILYQEGAWLMRDDKEK